MRMTEFVNHKTWRGNNSVWRKNKWANQILAYYYVSYTIYFRFNILTWWLLVKKNFYGFIVCAASICVFLQLGAKLYLLNYTWNKTWPQESLCRNSCVPCLSLQFSANLEQQNCSSTVSARTLSTAICIYLGQLSFLCGSVIWGRHEERIRNEGWR